MSSTVVDQLLGKPISEKKLSSATRGRMSGKTFAIPSERKYPIPDISHARNALARVSQHGSPEEKKKVRAAVHRRYPSLGKLKEGHEVDMSDPEEREEVTIAEKILALVPKLRGTEGPDAHEEAVAGVEALASRLKSMHGQ